MADTIHIHFTLSPDNPREKNIIEILGKLPNRQVKSFIVSLIEGQAELPQIAAEVHALAVHFGLEVDLSKPTSKETNKQFPGQVSIYDVDEQTPVKNDPQNVPEPEPVTVTEDIEVGPEETAVGDPGDMPDDVLDFVGGLNDWNE